MSMELHVLSDRRLNSISEWQRAIDVERFQLRLSGNINFAAVGGMLPTILEGKHIGFECYHDNAFETLRFLGASNFSHFWKYALGFRWGADLSALEAVWMAATAYAATTGGIIFDHEEGRVFSPRQARDLVAKFISERPLLKVLMQDITRRFPQKP